MRVYGRNITEAGHISHLLQTELEKYSLTQILKVEAFLTEENSADRLTRGLLVEELASKDT